MRAACAAGGASRPRGATSWAPAPADSVRALVPSQVETLGVQQRAACSRWTGAHFESAFPRDWLDDNDILPKSKRSDLLHVPLMPDRGSFVRRNGDDDDDDD